MLPAWKPSCITKLPPCLTFWWACWGPTCFPSPIQYHDLPFELNLFIFVSLLENHTFPIISGPVLVPWSKRQVCKNICTTHSGFFCCTCAPNLASLKAHLTIMSNNNLHVLDQSCFVVANAIPSRPSVTRVTQRLFSRFARSFGRHPLCLSISPLHSSSDVL